MEIGKRVQHLQLLATLQSICQGGRLSILEGDFLLLLVRFSVLMDFLFAVSA